MKLSVTRELIISSLILLFLISNVAPVQGVTAVFEIGQVNWGTSTTTAIQVYSGDRNVPLTVTVVNLDTYWAVNGIRGWLYLPKYFTDVNNSTNAYASYSSTTGVKPGQAFTLIFWLNIAYEAPPTTYTATLCIKYLTMRPGNATQQETDQYLQVTMSLSSKPPTTPSFSVTSSGQFLMGGRMETLNIKITNIHSYSLSEINATLAMPSSIIALAGNRWYFPNLGSNNSTEFKTQIFASSNDLGEGYSATLTIKYRDNTLGQTRQETYPIGLAILGPRQIRMTVYGITVTPSPVAPGSTVTITATLLNKGTINAYYANATTILSNLFIRIPESIVYVGDVPYDSPTPFSLSTRISPRAGNGTFPLTVQVTFEDDQGVESTLTFKAGIVVSTVARTTEIASRGTAKGFDWWSIAPIVGVGAIVGIVVAIILYRRRSRFPEEAREEPEKVADIHRKKTHRFWKRVKFRLHGAMVGIAAAIILYRRRSRLPKEAREKPEKEKDKGIRKRIYRVWKSKVPST